MHSWIALAIGFGVTVLGGGCVKPFLDWLRCKIVVPPISDDPSINQHWLKLQEHPPVSGWWVGNVERVVLFGAVMGASWEAVGVWFAFKLAAKWEAWNHMGFVPDDPVGNQSVGEQSVHPLKWAYARRVWAAQGYATFVVGTAVNLVLAALGASIAKCGWRIWCLACTSGT